MIGLPQTTFFQACCKLDLDVELLDMLYSVYLIGD